MTVDLWMLAAAVALNFALILFAATPGLIKDPKWGLGNRDKKMELPAWALRADRTAQNMKENLPMFAAIVLVAHVSGSANEMSAWGSQLFLVARIAHSGAYIAGIPGLRTALWATSVVGMFMVGSSLF